jgi:hypothetical protein
VRKGHERATHLPLGLVSGLVGRTLSRSSIATTESSAISSTSDGPPDLPHTTLGYRGGPVASKPCVA